MNAIHQTAQVPTAPAKNTGIVPPWLAGGPPGGKQGDERGVRGLLERAEYELVDHDGALVTARVKLRRDNFDARPFIGAVQAIGNRSDLEVAIVKNRNAQSVGARHNA